MDSSGYSMKAIRANLESLSMGGEGLRLLRADALAAIRRLARGRAGGAPFDLVLLDPPYGRDLARKSLIALQRYAIVSPNGLVVIEHDKRDPLPVQLSGEGGSFFLKRSVRYGDTALSLYERQ